MNLNPPSCAIVLFQEAMIVADENLQFCHVMVTQSFLLTVVKLVNLSSISVLHATINAVVGCDLSACESCCFMVGEIKCQENLRQCLFT